LHFNWTDISNLGKKVPCSRASKSFVIAINKDSIFETFLHYLSVLSHPSIQNGTCVVVTPGRINIVRKRSKGIGIMLSVSGIFRIGEIK
jgi:hypothetical protein